MSFIIVALSVICLNGEIYEYHFRRLPTGNPHAGFKFQNLQPPRAPYPLKSVPSKLRMLIVRCILQNIGQVLVILDK